MSKFSLKGTRKIDVLNFVSVTVSFLAGFELRFLLFSKSNQSFFCFGFFFIFFLLGDWRVMSPRIV